MEARIDIGEQWSSSADSPNWKLCLQHFFSHFRNYSMGKQYLCIQTLLCPREIWFCQLKAYSIRLEFPKENSSAHCLAFIIIVPAIHDTIYVYMITARTICI